MRRTLVITDLTYMWADMVCIAGVDEDGECVRPIIDDGVRQHHLFRDGLLLVYPRARVEFDLSPTEIRRPHIEDYTFSPESVTYRGVCNGYEWETLLRRTASPGVEALFDGLLEDGRRVPPDSFTKSLGTIADVTLHEVLVDESQGRRQFRMNFTDSTGKKYERYPINDLAFRAVMEKRIELGSDARDAELSAAQAIKSAHRLFLRIGLSRPDVLGNYPEACWTQITGVYTFPDYLKGKTFADFV